MKNRTLKVITYFISLSIIAIILFFSIAILLLHKKDPDIIMDYINEHPKKSSLVIKKNDKYIYSKNAYVKYPVASLFKLIIAIELIHQYQEGKIDLSEKVSVKKLDEYNLTPKMNKSYEQWKNENLKNKKKISLYTIAKGMIDYSANPNADYLIDKLKIENVNNRAKIITSGNHDQIFKIESTLLVPLYIKEIENKNPEKELKSINDEKFNYKIQKTEEALRQSRLKNIHNFNLSENEHALISKHLPKASAKDYINILNKRNSNLDKKKYQNILNELLNIGSYKKGIIYGKNGTTPSINNKVIEYNKRGDIYTISLFTNEQNGYEHTVITRNIDDFIYKIIDGRYKKKNREGL